MQYVYTFDTKIVFKISIKVNFPNKPFKNRLFTKLYIEILENW